MKYSTIQYKLKRLITFKGYLTTLGPRFSDAPSPSYNFNKTSHWIRERQHTPTNHMRTSPSSLCNIRYRVYYRTECNICYCFIILHNVKNQFLTSLNIYNINSIYFLFINKNLREKLLSYHKEMSQIKT